MRYALIALAIAGCGGHSKPTDGDAAVSPQALTLDEIARACENGYACLKLPFDGPTIPTCLSHLDDTDTIVSIYRPAQIRCLAQAGADCAMSRSSRARRAGLDRLRRRWLRQLRPGLVHPGEVPVSRHRPPSMRPGLLRPDLEVVKVAGTPWHIIFRAAQPRQLKRPWPDGRCER